jgi:hypothetical protein
MSNFRWGIIAALCALFASVAIGVISGVGILHIFLRALIFSALFFGIGFGLRFVVNSFLPELLYTEDQLVPPEIEDSGEQVNITLDAMGEYAVPELYKDGDSGELGNIEDLISGSFRPRGEGDDQGNGYQNFSPLTAEGGIDLSQETGYNDGDTSFGVSDFGEPALKGSDNFQGSAASKKPDVERPVFTPSFGDDDSGLGGLPDLDMMATAFSPTFGSDPMPSHVQAASVSPVPSVIPLEEVPETPRNTGNKPQPMDRDYDAKSLAEGIRTVLSKSN